MNRIILALSFIFALSATSEAQKIGYINSQEILFSLPEVKQANSDIDVMKAMFQKKGEDMVKELQTKYQALQQKQASGELAPIEIEKQSAALKAEEAKLGEFENSSQQKIYEKSEELLKPIQDKITKAIKDVAAENNFLYIIDSGMGVVLYADPAADVTKLVKVKLGISQ
ncbi:MAG: OmpH family outer membrane protein [Saprospiraceae bacterium]|jgi:outer membrane protein|nr:OmpH family outer membrane protein [Saprospiraceae bacterium]